MPEFILDHGTPEAAKVFRQLDAFTQGYITAMFFTDASGPDDGDLQDATFDELAPDALAKIEADCGEFGELVTVASMVWEGGWKAIRDKEGEGLVGEHAGRDFWYTRNGHGCGFWDGDWPEPYAAALTKAAKQFRSLYLYRGGDGLVYLD